MASSNDVATPAAQGPAPAVGPAEEVRTVGWLGSAPTVDDLWARAHAARSAEEVRAAYDEVQGELNRTRSELDPGRTGEPSIGAPRTELRDRLEERADELARISRVLLRAAAELPAPPASAAVRRLAEAAGEGGRPRTNAERRAFLLHEALSEAAPASRPRPAPAASAAAPPPARERGRAASAAEERRAIREAAREARLASVCRFVAEVAYAAIPFDEPEKRDRRAAVLEEAASAAAAALRSSGDEPAALASAAEAVALAVGGCGDPVAAEALVEASFLEAGSPLRAAALAAAASVEARVVAAVAEARSRAAATERALASLGEGTEGSDPALLERRALRESGRAPTLLEAVYVANARAVRESTGAAGDPGAVMAEAVGQYTLLETLSAFGLVRLGAGADLDAAAARVARL